MRGLGTRTGRCRVDCTKRAESSIEGVEAVALAQGPEFGFPRENAPVCFSPAMWKKFTVLIPM